MKLEGWIAKVKDGHEWMADSDRCYLVERIAQKPEVNWGDPIRFSGHVSLTIPAGEKGAKDGIS